MKKFNPTWDTDTVFNEARLIIAAMHQIITYKEYLPPLLGQKYMDRYDLNVIKAGYFYGYDASIDGSVANAFTTAAFRFGHSMIIVKVNSKSCAFSYIILNCQLWVNLIIKKMVNFREMKKKSRKFLKKAWNSLFFTHFRFEPVLHLDFTQISIDFDHEIKSKFLEIGLKWLVF